MALGQGAFVCDRFPQWTEWLLLLRLPVYLDEEALAFVQRIARKKKIDVSSVVNELILSNERLAEVID